MKTRSVTKSLKKRYHRSSHKRKRLPKLKVNKTAQKSIDFWTKTAEDHRKILNIGNEDKQKSAKLEEFYSKCFKRHVRITLESTIRHNNQLFQTLPTAIDEYVYNIDINVNEIGDDSSKQVLEDFTPWFQIKKSHLGSDISNNYGLFALREFKKDEYIGMYFGRMIERNIQIESNERDNYRFKDLTCNHEDSFIGLHFMNDPLFQIYDKKFDHTYEYTSNIDRQKQLRENVTNAVLRNDYLALAKVRIKKKQ